MIKKIVYKLLRHRHFWRDIGFDELSELYVSMMFRGLAISLTGLFIPVYLLKLDYNVSEILMVATWYFTARAVAVDVMAGYTTAKIGPKHTMIIGYLLLILSSALFLTLPTRHWPIWLLGGIWGASASYIFIPFHVDFSKVKHSLHGGKELGFLNIMEKFGSIIGPVCSGIVATIFGVKYIFLAATLLLLAGLVPLLRTPEPLKINQKFKFTSFKVDKLKHTYISIMAFGVENALTMYLWPLFLGMFVLIGDAVYAELGIISSISFLVSIASATAIGTLIDSKKGGSLLRISACANALLHVCRPFVNSLPLALGTNMANEAFTPGYRMPYMKGLYDEADELSKYRIEYITSIELMASIAKATVWWLLVILLLSFKAREVMVFGFAIAAAASCLIMTERFRALQPKHIIKS